MNKEDIEDAEIIEEEHYGIMPKTDKRYRTWVYNRIDGEMLSKIVDGPTAEELYKEGWRMTPAEFHEKQEVADSPEFIAVADDIAQQMNFLINVDQCDDKQILTEFAEGFLGLKIRKNFKVDTIRQRIKSKANDMGYDYNDDSSGTS